MPGALAPKALRAGPDAIGTVDADDSGLRDLLQIGRAFPATRAPTKARALSRATYEATRAPEDPPPGEPDGKAESTPNAPASEDGAE